MIWAVAVELNIDAKMDLQGRQQPQRPPHFSYFFAIVSQSIREGPNMKLPTDADPPRLSGPQRRPLRLPSLHAGQQGHFPLVKLFLAHVRDACTYYYYSYLLSRVQKPSNVANFSPQNKHRLNFTVRVEPVLTALAVPAAARAESEAAALPFRIGLVHVRRRGRTC